MSEPEKHFHRGMLVPLLLPATTLLVWALAERSGAIPALYRTAKSLHPAVTSWIRFDGPVLGWGLLTLICTGVIWFGDYDWRELQWTKLAVKLTQVPFLALLLGGLSLLIAYPLLFLILAIYPGRY